MIRSVHLTSHGELTRELGHDAMSRALADASGVLWVHVSGKGESEHSLLSKVFGFHHLAIDDCFNGRVDTPKIDEYPDHLFIITQSVSYHGRSHRIDPDEVALFLGKGFLVTVAEKPVAAVEELVGRAELNPALLARGADFLAHTVLDSLVDLLLPAVEDLDEALEDLEQRILTRPEPASLEALLRLKRNSLRLRRSILPQRDLVNRLSRGEYPDLIRNEALIFYRDVYDHIVRVEEMADTLRDVADSALNSYLSSVNNRMNEVMKTLSIVAAIFLPLTLIASIFGTNLDYSPFGLTLHAGFFVMLALMIAITFAMVGYFRFRRWF